MCCSIWIQISVFVIRLCAAHTALNVNNKNPTKSNSQSDATCRVYHSPFNEKERKKSNQKLSPLIFYVHSSSKRVLEEEVHQFCLLKSFLLLLLLLLLFCCLFMFGLSRELVEYTYLFVVLQHSIAFVPSYNHFDGAVFLPASHTDEYNNRSVGWPRVYS